MVIGAVGKALAFIPLLVKLFGNVVLNKGTRGFMCNSLLIPKQDQFMV